MKKNKLNITLTILGLVFLALLPLSCGADSENKTVYIKDPNGYFHTNNIQRAQKEIPFTIITPTYLPDIFGSNYPYQIDGPVKADKYHEVEVTISYVKDNITIYITEYNITRIMSPTKELNPVYLDIAGTRVLRQMAQQMSSTNITEGLIFDWIQNRLTFSVETYSISENESLKVVESMISQIK
jgi:hypothetical protein